MVTQLVLAKPRRYFLQFQFPNNNKKTQLQRSTKGCKKFCCFYVPEDGLLLTEY